MFNTVTSRNLTKYVMRRIIQEKEKMKMPMTPKDMIRLLKKNGFICIKSNNGSHQKYRHLDKNITVSVLMHAKELKKGIE